MDQRKKDDFDNHFFLLGWILFFDLVFLGFFAVVCDWSVSQFRQQEIVEAEALPEGKADPKREEELEKEADPQILQNLETEVQQDPETEEKWVALTFDDGPSEYTETLLDELQKRNVKATFFVIGSCASQYPEIVKREAKEGHLVGNHTYDHVQLTKISKEKAREQITKTNELLENITGKKTEYIRPPYGSIKDQDAGGYFMTIVLWDVDPKDWRDRNADLVERRILKEVKNGDIILLHDAYKSSVEAAIRVVDELQEKGYHFVTVDELMID